MGSPQYGARKGRRLPVYAQVDSTSAAIEVGDLLTVATTGYVKQAAAGETLRGVAMSAVASPAADGDLSVLMDISEETIYAYPPDAGTVTQALVGTSMDIGGAQSINIDASTVDNVFVDEVDIDGNLVLCHFSFAFTGVV